LNRKSFIERQIQFDNEILKIEKNYRNGNKVVYGSDTEENKTHEEFDESAETVRSEAPKNILLGNNSI
jgi:hypothetical protein